MKYIVIAAKIILTLPVVLIKWWAYALDEPIRGIYKYGLKPLYRWTWDGKWWD